MTTTPVPDLASMDADALRHWAQASMARQQAMQDEIRYKDAKTAQLTHEITALRRYQFGKKGEQLSGVQASLLDLVEVFHVLDELAAQASSDETKSDPLS